MTINRRRFLAGAGGLLAATQIRAADERKPTAAIIGHTGKGDYGHGMDLIFSGLPGVELAALADPDEAGRAKAVKRCKPLRQYERWKEMLDWRPIDDDPSLRVPLAERTNASANRRLADDWLASIAENREPACSGQNAAMAVEMEMAVWRAGLAGGRVMFPLKERGHPLALK
jgi:hypothetical protein